LKQLEGGLYAQPQKKIKIKIKIKRKGRVGVRNTTPSFDHYFCFISQFN